MTDFANLIQAIISSHQQIFGASINKIADESGVQQSSLSRFMNDKGTLSMENMEKLLDYLGYEIKQPTRYIVTYCDREDSESKCMICMNESEAEAMESEIEYEGHTLVRTWKVKRIS